MKHINSGLLIFIDFQTEICVIKYIYMAVYKQRKMLLGDTAIFVFISKSRIQQIQISQESFQWKHASICKEISQPEINMLNYYT